METIIALCFVKSYNDKEVKCYFFELEQLRMINKDPFFVGMKLYKGKNIIFTTKTNNSGMVITCTQMPTKKITQLWNYYVKGLFK